MTAQPEDHGRKVDMIAIKAARYDAPPKPDIRPHRTAFYKVDDLAQALCGDICLVPDPENLDELKREDLTKISHWSDIEPADIPRLAVLTDSFFRFIDEGQDASVITLWRGDAPLIQQIGGEPCEAAVDAVMDAVTNMRPLVEKWGGLPPLEAEIERLAYEKRLTSSNRPKWLEREARRRLEARGADPDARVSPDNDNRPEEERLCEAFEGGVIRYDSGTRRQILADCWHDGKLGSAVIGFNGEPLFTAYATQPKPPIRATPFSLRDPASLPERDWLFARHYIRRYLTATVGAGGGGKSAHAVSETLAMVTGRPLLEPDEAPAKPLRVWYINAEDPQDEIDRRFHAAAKHFDVDAAAIADRLYTDSGRDQEFVVMRQEGRGFQVCQPVIDEMVQEIQKRQIDVVIIDPLVSTHEVPENDNGAMQRVAKAWTEVADRANCCVEVVHHIVKNAGEATADSARGGGALKDKTRGMRVINAMTQAEAEKVGLDGPEGYFRIDHGKVNLVASGRSAWRHIASVPLGNGRGIVKNGDEIGVVEPWHWPAQDVLAERAAERQRAVVAAVPADVLAGLKVRLENGNYKAHPQGKPWAGEVVMELTGQHDAKVAKAMLDAWLAEGELEIIDIPDAYRKPKPHIKPAAAL